MGNCFSYCILQPDEYEQLNYIVTSKKNTCISKHQKKQTQLYDSCVF